MMYGKKGPGDPKKKKKKATRSMVSKLPMSVGSDYNPGYLDSLFNETGPKSRKAKETLRKLPGRKVSKPKN
jgi:hypothetical protein